MKKTILTLICIAAASMALTGCTDKFEGDWTICTKDGKEVAEIEFDDDEFELKGEDGEFEVVENGRIKLEFDDDDMDDKYGGKHDYEIIDKKNAEIYIEDISEMYASREYNTAASSIYKALNSAFVEMDENDEYVNAYGLYSPDKNYSTVEDTDLDTIKLKKKTENYFSDLDDYKFFAYIDYGCCYVVFCADDWDSEIVGTYMGDAYVDYEGMTLEEVYEEFADEYNFD